LLSTNLIESYTCLIKFHYDSKELSRGYKYFFEKLRPYMKAYMSVGDDRNKTRFYFSDAATRGSLEEKINSQTNNDFMTL